jgi:hypothetical protein
VLTRLEIPKSGQSNTPNKKAGSQAKGWRACGKQKKLLSFAQVTPDKTKEQKKS